MDDLISRQAAIDALWAERMKHDEEMERNLETCSFALRADNKARRNRVEEDIEIIRQLPPAQPKRGKWIEGNHANYWKCSECGEVTMESVMGKPRHNFCPNCGAKMETGKPEGGTQEWRVIDKEAPVPVSWIEKEIEFLKSQDNEFAGLAASNISGMLNKWRDEQNG